MSAGLKNKAAIMSAEGMMEVSDLTAKDKSPLFQKTKGSR
jgi:hypothetical protein